MGLGALITIAVFQYYSWHWGTYENFNRSIEFCELRFCDFTLFYLEQAKVILDSHAPIVKYFYSPTFALFLTPLADLPGDRAVEVWGYVQAFSLVLYLASGLYLMRRLAWWSHAVFLFLTLTSYPILHNWKWGQANTLFMALAMTSLVLRDRAPASLSSFPLAIAAASRYFPAIYAVAFLHRRYLRVLVAFAAITVVLLVGVPAVLMGPQATWDFYVASSEASRFATSTWVVSSTGSQYLPTVLARVMTGWQLGTPSARSVLVAISYLFAVANAVAAIRAKRVDEENEPLWVICFAGASTPLLVPTSWMHYFVFLAPAQAFLLTRVVRCRAPLAVRVLLVLGAFIPCVGLASIFLFNQFAFHGTYVEGGYLFFSSLLMLLLAHGLFWSIPSAREGSAKESPVTPSMG